MNRWMSRSGRSGGRRRIELEQRLGKPRRLKRRLTRCDAGRAGTSSFVND